MADKIAVINNGKLHQWGTAYELYHQPASVFVAQFIGESVFLQAERISDCILSTAVGEFDMSHAFFAASAEIDTGQYFSLLVRPDDVKHDNESAIKARVKSRVFRGSHTLYTLELAHNTEGESQRLLCLTSSHHDLTVDDYFGISLQLENMIVFPCIENQIE
jgi:iron(III) transport system ATP-binding protein